MQTKKLVWGTAALAAAGLALSACGSSSTKTGATTAPTVKQSAFNAALTAVVNPSDKAGGDLKLQASGDFDSLDPARTYYAYSWDFQRLWQRTLMAFNPAPGADGNKVVPDLATTAGTSTPDEKTWTYHLRKGIKFQDGTPVTAKDYKYAVERIFATTVITGGPTYLVDLLGGAASYKGPYVDHSAAGLTTVTTPDDYTIVFHLTKAFSDFNDLMAIPGSTPVEASVDQNKKTGGANYQFNVQSVGPYEIAPHGYVPNKSLSLIRNPNWSAKTDPLRKALPDTIHLTEGLDPVVMDNNLFTGTSDLTIDGFGVQTPSVPKIYGNPTLKAQADDGPGAAMRYISIQQNVAPLNNVHCRRAVQYAADKVALQGARGGPIAGGTIQHAMVVPTLNSYEPSYDPYPSGPKETGDLVQARAELKLCGKPNGFKVNLATTNKGKGPLVATALQEGLKRVGIDVNIEAVDSATYYSGFIGSQASIKAHQLGLAVAGWGPDFPTEYGYWESIVDGRNLAQSVNSDYAGLNDPAINKDIDDALATNDPAKKNAIWIDLSHRVMDSADLLPFVSDVALGFHPANLTNVVFSQAFGLYDYMNLGVTS